MTWTAYSNRATNATYQVFDGTTLLGTVQVNQQLAPSYGLTVGGTPFQSLGQFTISSGTLKVVLSDNANGYVVADAMLVQVYTGPTVIDNGQSGYSETGTGWNPSRIPTPTTATSATSRPAPARTPPPGRLPVWRPAPTTWR